MHRLACLIGFHKWTDAYFMPYVRAYVRTCKRCGFTAE